MSKRTLDPAQLGPGEDWLGNNAAFTCPVCGKVFLVSGFLQSARLCPSCGESRGEVTGSPAKGGSAWITWGDKPSFALGKEYTRAEISHALGGSPQSFLPMSGDRVLCGCFDPERNPNAPEVILPGTGEGIEASAEAFCRQDHAVPVFLKRRINGWEYVGQYKVARWSADREEIVRHHAGSSTPLRSVTRVMFLQRADAGAE